MGRSPGGRQLGQQVFVDIAPHIGILNLTGFLVDAVHGGDNFIQHQGRGNFENGIPHVFGIGAVLVGMQTLNKREDPFLHDAVHLCGGKIMEHRPFQLIAGDGPFSDGNLTVKNAFVRQAQHGAFFGALVVGCVQIVNKHQIGHLFHDIQGVGDTACPEDFPETVDFIFQFIFKHKLTPCRGIRRGLYSSRGPVLIGPYL